MVSAHSLVSAFFLVGLASCVITLEINARPLHGGSNVILGTLRYNQELQQAEVTDVPEPKIEEGQYCVGPVQDGEFVCQSVAYLSIPLQYELKVNTKANGDLSTLSLVKSNKAGIIPTIIKPHKGPQPVLREAPKPVIDEATGEVVDEKEEPPKSFLQQYWMYIVPVLILLMVNGNQEAS